MELTLLKDIVIIFALSTLVNLLFTRLKIPTVVGYLMTGIVAGPHLLGIVHSLHQIELLAEVGVVFLLFTIGMEFSLQHLLKIRRIVFLGGLMQVFLTALAFYGLSRFYDLSWKAGMLIGFLAALSSSALVLKLLQERSELSSNYGRTVLGILIFQDLLLVPLLLFTNMLGNDQLDVGRELGLLALKATGIIAFVFVGNRWLLPRLLHIIALTRNQELFMMSIFLICLSIAMLTAQLGMSLAFGAFLAGLMISESPYSHNAFANLVPFKDTFTSFFFVSIGMLLDASFVFDNFGMVLLSVFFLVVIKLTVASSTGFILGHTFRGTVLVGMALSQVGEFSFILAKMGLENKILDNYFYQLFLAVSIITMALTPFLIKWSNPLANRLMRFNLPKVLKDGLFPLPVVDVPNLKHHLVIIGKDTSAQKLSRMAKINQLPHVSIVFDPLLAKDKMADGDLVVYGDAVNQPILLHAHTEAADIVVVSVGSLIPSMAIVEQIRNINKNAYLIVRVKEIDHVAMLYELGADQVLPEKLEIALDLFNRVLVKMLHTRKDVNRILTHMRHIALGELTERDIVNRPTILDELPNVAINAIRIEPTAPADGKTLVDLQLRNKAGVTLLAIKRADEIIEHPAARTTLLANDIVYVLGNPDQVNLAAELFHREPEGPTFET